MIRASYRSYTLRFKRTARTSRGTLHEKKCWYITLCSPDGIRGTGEVSHIPGLSVGDPAEIESRMGQICRLINRGEVDPSQPVPSFPGIRFALETAWKDLRTGGKRLLHETGFTSGESGIPINGLIWMGNQRYMLKQVGEKVKSGYRVLKLKVGSLEYGKELELLETLRREYGTGDLEIRLDANGAWSPWEALEKIGQLAHFDIHSIEQPIARGQGPEMARICSDSPVPIALDEELPGIDPGERSRLLEQIRPAYLILKPGLLGGTTESESWIGLADEMGIGWWITSALESNVGLNAIAQWTATLDHPMTQGLGTGMLYANNIPSPMEVEKGELWYRPEKEWQMEATGEACR